MDCLQLFLHLTLTLHSFKRQLKTHLFQQLGFYQHMSKNTYVSMLEKCKM